MVSNAYCRECDALVPAENFYPSNLDHNRAICKACQLRRGRERYARPYYRALRHLRKDLKGTGREVNLQDVEEAAVGVWGGRSAVSAQEVEPVVDARVIWIDVRKPPVRENLALVTKREWVRHRRRARLPLLQTHA